MATRTAASARLDASLRSSSVQHTASGDFDLLGGVQLAASPSQVALQQTRSQRLGRTSTQPVKLTSIWSRYALAALVGAFLLWSAQESLSCGVQPVATSAAWPSARTLHPKVIDAVNRPEPPLWQSDFDGQRIARYNPAEHLLDDLCSLPPGKTRPQRIPKIIHFIFGLSTDFGNSPFNFVHYMSVLSAKQRVQPKAIYMHHIAQPSGYWWEQARHMVTLVKARNVTRMYGHELSQFAHRADIIRLEALYRYGGIYMDIDTLALVPFDAFLHHDFIIGIEGDADYGLANSVMAAAPGSLFVLRWLSSYAAFRSDQWAEHSIVVPKRLALEHPDELCILPPHAFSFPLSWTKEGQELMFTPLSNDQAGGVLTTTPVHDGTLYNVLYMGQYALHLAEHGSEEFLREFDYQYIHEARTVTRMSLLMGDILRGLPAVPRAPDYSRHVGTPSGPSPPSKRLKDNGAKLLTHAELLERIHAAKQALTPSHNQAEGDRSAAKQAQHERPKSKALPPAVEKLIDGSLQSNS